MHSLGIPLLNHILGLVVEFCLQKPENNDGFIEDPPLIDMGDSVTSTYALEKHRDREVDNVYRVRRHVASFILSSWVS